MKYIVNAFLFILWLIFTLILGISIVGLIVLFFPDPDEESPWFKLGKQILNNLS